MKLDMIPAVGKKYASLPVRGAWIEIVAVTSSTIAIPVAPRKGSVD